MQPKALVQLVGSGSTARVEEEWMRLIESPQVNPLRLAEYQPVLTELCGRGKKTEAEALAWAAIETVLPKTSPRDVLPMAGAFLLGLGDSPEFRKQVTELFRKAHSDREGLESLLAEAGLPGGRPVRRALRTLDVALALQPGSFLVDRETNEAARVEAVETGSWEFTVTAGGKRSTFGAVHLADRYRPASDQDFHVLRTFEPERLRRTLEDDPTPILTELCKQNGGKLESEALAEMLAESGLVPEDDWKRWWSKARAALKKSPHFRIEGRSPYTVYFEQKAIDHDAQFREEFNKHRDPFVRFELLEKHVRESGQRGDTPSRETLGHCYEVLREHAREAIKARAGSAVIVAAMAWQAGELADVPDAAAELFEVMKHATSPGKLLESIRRDDLLERAVKALYDTRQQDCREVLLSALPKMPQAYCDRAVEWLVQGGCGQAELAPVVQRILSAPIPHFDAMLWLWDGPAYTEIAAQLSPVMILSRILRALQDARLSDAIDKETVRTMAQHARSALSARGYERYEAALKGIDGGMALALRNQLNQADNLGRAVQDGLLRKISPHLPKREAGPAVMPWDLEHVIYTTEAGLARKQNEVEHHVNVKMRENAIAIGAAAEKGDLSENSEYKFALEERDLLQARLAQMNSEVQGARVIQPDDVPTDHVGIGTRVVLRRTSDGKPYEMTLVGPWESDLELNRFNYKAPLARVVLGKRVGDAVEFEHTGASGTYEIIELHNGLREMAAQLA